MLIKLVRPSPVIINLVNLSIANFIPFSLFRQLFTIFIESLLKGFWFDHGSYNDYPQ